MKLCTQGKCNEILGNITLLCPLLTMCACASLFVDYSVDKESNFKRHDYAFMRQLRSNHNDVRENMTHTMTQKLLENQRKASGRQESI